MKKNILLILFVVMAIPLSVNASSLLVNSAGKLTGATDVIVNGDAFNVLFVEGTCADVFNGCNDSTDFFFETRTEASNAGQALLDQVFIDGAAGNFDSDITSIFGCEQATIVCVGMVTYQFGLLGGEVNGGSTNLLTDVVIFSRNFEAGSSTDNVGGTTFQNSGGLISIDTSVEDRTVWAVFSAPTPVPVPAAVWLFGSGLIGLVGMRRKTPKSPTLSA